MNRWGKGLILTLVLALGLPGLAASALAGEAGAEEFGGFSVVCADSAAADYADGVLTLSGAAEVSGGAPGERIVLEGECHLTLAGVTIRAEGGPGITIASGAEAELTLAPESRSTVTGDANYAGIQVTFAGDNSARLTVRGDGRLTAQGGRNAAGIGGSFRESVFYGDITLESGHITAQGGSNAAGIGSGVNSMGDPEETKMGALSWGVITVNGGDINAQGSGSGAGIGGGNHADSGKIVINGGTVNAVGASGIGSGVGSASTDRKGRYGPGYYYGSVKITGGTVTARGGENGAGIGGAMYADGEVTITGGQISAFGGSGGQLRHGGAGIGGGYQGHGDVTITGGSVITTGGGGAAGIGSGSAAAAAPEGEDPVRGDGARYAATGVLIEGGIVTATGGAQGGAGIGGGVGADRIIVRVVGGIVETNGGGGSRGRPLGGAGLGSAAGPEPGKEDSFPGTRTQIVLTGGTVSALGAWGGAGIGGGSGNTPPESLTVTPAVDITAFSDGARFALDTRERTAEAKIDVAGVLQATFVDLSGYERRDYEGLAVDLRTGEETEETVVLPEGYRSFARSVTPGDYTIAAGPETFAAGVVEKAIPGRLTGGSTFTVTGESMADARFLAVRTVRTAQVIWQDREDLDRSRQDLTLFLLQDGQQAGEAVISAQEAAPELTVWDDLAKYSADGSRELVYAVVPGEMEGYTPAVTGEEDAFTVTMTHVPEMVRPEGFLYWLGGPEASRPETVELTLLADGEPVGALTVRPGENGVWRYSFGPRTATLERRRIAYTLAADLPGWRVLALGWDLMLIPESVSP